MLSPHQRVQGRFGLQLEVHIADSLVRGSYNIQLRPLTQGRRIFCSYSHRDSELMSELTAHFAGLISIGKVSLFWSDDRMTAGMSFDAGIAAELNAANVILLLISADYISSEYCWNIEAPLAFKLHEAGSARVVSILLRDAHWRILPLSRYVVLPRNEVAVTNSGWTNRDEAFRHIVEEVERVIDEFVDPESILADVFPEQSRSHVKVTTDEVFHCVPQVEEVTIRSVGITELLGDVLLDFRGDPGPNRVSDIWIYWNTNLTSRIESGNFSEIALTIAAGQCIRSMPGLGRAYVPFRLQPTPLHSCMFRSMNLDVCLSANESFDLVMLE